MLPAGSVIGSYVIVGTLGQGGMATVYLAEDRRHGRQVAVKVMKAETAASIGSDRFLREIETVARLTHPHILPLYDSGSADGQLFYVMPHIIGSSLRERLKAERLLPVEEAVRIASGVAAALGHAHEHGLVHRDVKPENVLLSGGIPLLADFGVARAPAQAADPSAETMVAAVLTRAGGVVGTPQYIAPEQVLGGDTVDGRADLYALGCVLYEMLAGQPPFSAPTVPALLLRHLNDSAPPIRALRPGLPEAVAAIVHRLLAKQPAQRYRTAADVIEALDAAAHGDRRSPPTGVTSVSLQTGTSASLAAPASTIAVLPFQTMGGSADDQCLADGICDELIHTLGCVEGLRVIARGSSFRFRDRRVDVRAIAAELHVAYLLDGTMRRAGSRLRVTVQLINAADGFQMWSERYDRVVDDVFALEEEIAGAVAGALRVRLAARGPATSFEAYERYVTGLHHWNRRTPQDFALALVELERATALDPAFAPAWGAIALVNVTRLLYGLCAPADAATRAVAAVDRALALDRGQTSALTARACLRAVHDWDRGAAERDFQEVIDRAPSDATARQWFAINLLAPLGRFDEAREQLARARELDPLSPSVLVSSGIVAHLSGDVPGALALFGRALSLDPAFGAARYFLGQALLSAGQAGDAVAALDAASAAMGHSAEVRAMLAVACAGAGERDRAAALLAGLAEAKDGRWVSPALIAMVRAALGDLDGAVADVERAIDARAVEVIWLETRPAWAPLRADARYPALIARRDAATRTATRTQS